MVPFPSRSPHACAHFCCYLLYLVHVTFAILQRNGRSDHFHQKNIMVLAQNASKTDLAHQLRPEGSEMLPGSLLRGSGELPKSLPRAS